jgi:Cu/Ag efflux protein CusF
MNTFTTCGLVAALTITASAAGAQTKTITGEQKTLTATVESIEAATRSVTVKKPDGTYEVFYVPSAIKKFDTLKIGDKVTARYYENVVLQVKAPGETGAGDKSASAVTRAPETAGTAGTAAHQRTITATIAAIDPKAPSITFTGPNGWKYSTRVEDTAALAKVKVGDKVEITWTEAMILSLDSGK